MIEFVKKAENPGRRDDRLPCVALNSDERRLVRQKITMDNREEAAVFLDRGSVMKIYDVLESDDGKNKVQVVGKSEEVVSARAHDWLSFAKACYYLGNRHAPLEIKDLEFFFLPDRVLEELCLRLGLEISHISAAFAPEEGAYAHHHHSHEHDHAHEEHGGHDHDEHDHDE